MYHTIEFLSMGSEKFSIENVHADFCRIFPYFTNQQTTTITTTKWGEKQKQNSKAQKY